MPLACVAEESDGFDDADLDADDDEDPATSTTTAVRVCLACTYKSKVTFSNLPTGTLTSANMEVTVRHAGACPQTGPSNCKEKLVYNVKCQLGTSSTATFPFFIDAASANTTHTAKITVVKSGVTTTHTGTVDFSSNVAGGGAPPSSIPTPCAPPTINPYVDLPTLI